LILKEGPELRTLGMVFKLLTPRHAGPGVEFLVGALKLYEAFVEEGVLREAPTDIDLENVVVVGKVLLAGHLPATTLQNRWLDREESFRLAMSSEFTMYIYLGN